MPTYQIIFFILGLVCSAPMLVWYYRRNPHPRFRPRPGEMAMVSLFAVLLSLGGSLLIGGLMDDPEQFNPKGAFSTIPTHPSQRAKEEAESNTSSPSSSKSREGTSRGGGR